MLSVIVYGRNDSHGYNLPKRAAISLNCIAEVLDDKDDEIIFVDCNTPNDMPTFPESIADTLTPATKRLLRVLRLRPEQYRKHCDSGSKTKVQEALCRNIAARRSNPNNRWILNTNTDMVFAPIDKDDSLSKIAKELPDGFLQLPRFVIPESLWESVDRSKPQEIISSFNRWGLRLHLNEIVTSSQEALFDQQGDFQLSLRSHFFQIHGMNEKMTQWGHVDSNFSKRMWFLNGRPNTILDKIYAFHCDHTRIHTASSGQSKTNDSKKYVDNVTTPYCPDQSDSWGMPDEIIEEIKLDSNRLSRISSALKQILPGMEKPIAKCVVDCNYIDTNLYYDNHHAFPYLAGIIANQSPGSNIRYVGNNPQLLSLIASFRSTLNHTGLIFYDEQILQWNTTIPGYELPSSCKPDAAKTYLSQSDTFIVDFSMKNFPARLIDACPVPAKCPQVEDFMRLMAARTIELARNEKDSSDEYHTPGYFIFVGCHTTSFDFLIKSLFSCGNSPISTCIRSGVISPNAFKTAIFMPFHYYVIGFTKNDYAEWTSNRIGRPVNTDDIKLVDELYNTFVMATDRQQALQAFLTLTSSEIGMGKLLLQIKIAETDGMPEQATALLGLIQQHVR